MRKLERYAAAALIAAIGVGWEATMGAAGARDSGNCPTAERAQIPEHLQSLKATATTVEGTGGITVDFVAHPLPPHRGKPWSHWGEGLVASNGRYYTAIGNSLGGTAIPTSTSTIPPARRCAPSATSSPLTASIARVTGVTARSTDRSARVRVATSTSTPTGVRIANLSTAAVTRATCSCVTTRLHSNW